MLSTLTPFFRDSRLALLSVLMWLTAVINLVAQPEWRSLSGQVQAALTDAPGKSGRPVDARAAAPPSEPNYPSEPMWHVTTRYDAMIASVARTHGLDPALLKAMVQAESAFEPSALSVDGAQGLMQLLPETAAQLGIVDLLNPYLNLQAGARHLVHLLERFDGDQLLSVAAYNAGEYAVRRHQGVPPYPETHRYLYRVFGLQSIYAGSAPVSPPVQPRRDRAAETIVVVSLE